MGGYLGPLALVTALLGATLVGLFFVPVDLGFRAGGGAEARFRLHWLFGLVRVEGRPRRRARPREPQSSKPRRRSHRARGDRTAQRMMAIEGLVPRAGRLAWELIRSVRWRRCRIGVRAGTGDPAETGELCGLIGPLLLWSPWGSALQVEFEPDFTQPVLQVGADLSCRIVPAPILSALGRFALSRPGRRAIKVLMWNRPS